MSNFLKKQIEKVYIKSGEIEFKKIQKTIDKFNIEKENLSVLDVGSGLCIFPLYFSKKNNKLKFSCVDINQELVELAKSHNFEAYKSNILNLPFDDNSFDIVHCSHVIEHLKYPDVINAINELFRVCKKNGIVIIRTPLRVNHRFYNDIDHIRPYPPDAIINFFNNEQQQQKGKIEIKEIKRWYTRVYFEFDYNRFPFKIVKSVNQFLKLMWLFINFPIDRPNNYGIVFKKK
ncbi:MAG: class I SAM-dependent methyltransferase [Bacteroidales bacterium]|nr:class I SAM-dependent methyltransferase [Bacteroidales bacterium]MBN2756793.1 class I SAM-dependent methyltransferase [Bacteroidales bacterium]